MSDALAKTELKEDGEAPANGQAAAPEVDAPASAEAAEDAVEGESTSDQKVVAKFLVSNAAAGSVIGKGGSNIAGGPAAARPATAPLPHAPRLMLMQPHASLMSPPCCNENLPDVCHTLPVQSFRPRARRASSCRGRMSTSPAPATASCLSAALSARCCTVLRGNYHTFCRIVVSVRAPHGAAQVPLSWSSPLPSGADGAAPCAGKDVQREGGAGHHALQVSC